MPSDALASEIVVRVVLSKMTITSDLPLTSNSLYSKVTVWVKRLAHAKPWPGGGAAQPAPLSGGAAGLGGPL